MKIAKSKIFIILLSLICFLTAGALMVNPLSAKAETQETEIEFFTCVNTNAVYNDAGDGSIDFAVDNSSRITIKNQLAVNNILISAKTTGIKKVTVTLGYESYFVNGVKLNEEDTLLQTDLTAELVVAKNETTSQLEISFEGAENSTAISNDLSIGFTTNENALSASVNGANATISKEEYKIAGKDKNVATISFSFEVEEADANSFSLVYVDQYADGTEAYKQTFKKSADKFVNAKPVISIDDSYLATNANDIKVISGKQTYFSAKAYSLTETITTTQLYLQPGTVNEEDGAISVPTATNPNYLIFNKKADKDSVNMQFNVVADRAGDAEGYPTVYATYTVKVLDDDNAVAPEYNVNNTKAIQLFRTALELAKTEEEDGQRVDVNVGDKVTIPSMQDFVSDDMTPYDNLTRTIHYWTPASAHLTTTGNTISITQAGKYIFYCVFADDASNPNSMDQDGFIEIDEEDENIITYKQPDLVFEFEIADSDKFTVEQGSTATQGKGYLNVAYTFKPFDIDARDYSDKYTLYYNEKLNATADDDGWLEVEEGDYFTEEDIESIAYNDKLTFTPNKAGSYKIVCQIVSSNETASQTASAVVSISDQPTIVKPDSKWLQNNVASVVFLSVGTVLLIVLLFIIFYKPKTEDVKKQQVKPKK